MLTPERIVAVLLDDAGYQPIDPRQYPHLYPFKYEDKGIQVFRCCSYCETEHAPMNHGRYVAGTGVSHSICQPHMDRIYRSMGKTAPKSSDGVPNWDEAIADGQDVPDQEEAVAPAKATFWASSGSGAY